MTSEVFNATLNKYQSLWSFYFLTFVIYFSAMNLSTFTSAVLSPFRLNDDVLKNCTPVNLSLETSTESQNYAENLTSSLKFFLTEIVLNQKSKHQFFTTNSKFVAA